MPHLLPVSGTPSVDGLGPIGGYQHSDKEYLDLPSLTERTVLFANVIAVCLNRADVWKKE